MDKLLIVDGSNLLFQMFYGMPARIVNSRGRSIHGTLGFVGALLKMLRMIQPTHLAVVFDGECRNSRKELDADYKANRPDYSQMPEEETPFSQLPDIYAALDLLGICHGETQDCEADDWIAGYARHLSGMMQVVIASQDSDFFQLIDNGVTVFRYRGKCSTVCDREYLLCRFGIQPEQYAAFKAMVGDTADNIRGAEKIGVKTAAALLREFGDLTTVIRSANCVCKPSVRESLIRNADRLAHNYELIYLSGAQQLPFSLDDMIFSGCDCGTMEVLREAGIL